jgi:hypothetical protein
MQFVAASRQKPVHNCVSLLVIKAKDRPQIFSEILGGLLNRPEDPVFHRSLLRRHSRLGARQLKRFARQRSIRILSDTLLGAGLQGCAS